MIERLISGNLNKNVPNDIYGHIRMNFIIRCCCEASEGKLDCVNGYWNPVCTKDLVSLHCSRDFRNIFNVCIIELCVVTFPLWLLLNISLYHNAKLWL